MLQRPEVVFGRRCRRTLWLAATLAMVGCQQGTRVEPTPVTSVEEEVTMGWVLTSSAFENGKTIPVKHTCEGEDISPELTWSEPPEGAAELALVCNDPDAPAGNWIHWVLYGLPADRRSLPETVPVKLHW